MKILKLAIVLVFLTGAVSASVLYDVSADSESAEVNTSVKLECEPGNCPVTRWTVTLNVPRGAEVTDVESQNGEVSNYDVYDDKLSIKTETPPSESELIKVDYRIARDAREMADGLYSRSIGLPGFPGESNSGTLVMEDLKAGSIGSNFQYSAKGNNFNFSGEGPTNFRGAFGRGETGRFYTFYGGEIQNSSRAYKISVGTTGIGNRFETLPVGLMSSREYNESLNKWSAGQYVNSSILMRDNLEENELPILAHETVHGLNSQYLGWNADSAWFDEGTAKYVEVQVKKSQGDRTSELFGDQVKYTRYRDGKRYEYTIEPRGDRDRLWNYYESDKEWMKSWRPQSGNRDFGYAYSELVIRNYVKEEGSLADLYGELDSTKFSSDEEKWSSLSGKLDLTPCKYDSRQQFDNCLDEINEYEYPIYSADNPESPTQSLEIERLEVEPPTEPETAVERNLENNISKSRKTFSDLFRELVERLTEMLN